MKLDEKEVSKLNVIKALSGQEALKIAMGKVDIDLIILDIQMPGMDGFEVAKFLKSTIKTKDIPVMFLTAAFKSEEFIKNGFDIGAIDYFTKPIDMHQFLTKINLYIKLFLNNKKLKEQTRKAESFSKSKSEFLANMSHEIRTPLNAILGFVELIKESTKEKKTLEYANIIDNSSQSLLNVIEDILDFSKIESGKLDIDKVNFNTEEEFNIISYLFKAKCLEKGITLEITLDDKLPEYIKTDPLRIKQIISNLLSNAIKFTQRDKKIYLNIMYEDGFLNISVRDEGKGIQKDKLSHIFEAFVQEDSSTTREFGGTGLGLSISSELVRLLGGELKAKSELGQGSEFYFSIPVTISKETDKKNKTVENLVFDGKKVLLVEDNKSNQMFMKVILKKMEFDIDIANDGIEAVEKFKLNKYDLILMDENMPNMCGIEATKNIIEFERENKISHTPIVALTANAIKGDRERFLEAGMDDYMSKPLNKSLFLDILKKIFTC